MKQLRVIKAGANDYIKKFSFEELIERIKIHLKSEELTIFPWCDTN
jgi:DNA-binding response OmpR family regulator